MITAAGCRSRRERLWAALDEKPDWILITDPQHVTYFTGFYATPFVFRSVNAPAVAILAPDGTCCPIADAIQEPFAKAAFADEVVLPTWYNGQHSASYRRGFLAEKILERLQAKHQGKMYGVEPATLPSAVASGLQLAYPEAKFFSIEQIVQKLKRRKDPDEVETIRTALHAAEVGLVAAMRETRPGMTEIEMYTIVQKAAVGKAGEPAVVYGDFVTGPRTEQGGGPPSDRVIRDGDLALLDFSVVLHGYRGDFANTFSIGGHPTTEQQTMFDACVEAMKAGEALLKPGASCAAIDRAVRASFEAKGLGQYFDSHVGHGLGLGHPDPPYFVPESSETLEIGDVVTIEPGQFKAGVGGMRIEDNYLITAAGFERLSHHPISLDPAAESRRTG